MSDGAEHQEQQRAVPPAPSVAPSVAPSDAASHVSGGGQSQTLGQQPGLAQVLVSSGLRVQPGIMKLNPSQVQGGLVTLGLSRVPFFCCHGDPCAGGF
jgi:hypothetical protein